MDTSSVALDVSAQILGRAPDQTGFVVPDVRAAARDALRLGIGPWSVMDYPVGTFGSYSFRGSDAPFATRSAVWGRGRLSFIQPLEGESAYSEALRERGTGLHHVGFFVDDLAPSIALLETAGQSEVMAMSGHGLDGDGALSFYTLPGTPCVVELIVRPARRSSPLEVIDFGG